MNTIRKTIKGLSSKARMKSTYAYKTEYYNFGCEYFGPLLYGFTEWLWKKTSPYPSEKVFFFSRDGYMMEKAYAFFNSERLIDTEYVYFSRKSIRQSLLFKCQSYTDSLSYMTQERFVTFGKILEYYGFSAKERRTISEKTHIPETREYNYNNLKHNKEIKSIFERYKDEITKKSRWQAALLKKYLLGINMNGKCSIVDIGWHGSMQYYLEKFAELNNLDIVFKGYYLGIFSTVDLKGTANGYLYSKKKGELRKRILCFLGGYEKLFQSLEGSTREYEYNNGKVLPVLCEYEFQGMDVLINHVKQWQAGAIDFLECALETHVEMKDERDWAMPIIRFGESPSLKEVQLFSFFYNIDGVKEYFISQKGLLLYTPNELIHTLSNSVWKTGFMKSVFKLPFPYFYIYRWMRK